MPYTPHPEFLTPPPEVTIWRYMNFPKFCSLLEKEALFMLRSDRFEDPWEGTYPALCFDENYWAEFFEKQSESAEAKRTNSENDPQLLAKEYVAKFKEMSRYRKAVGLNCWHINTKESEAFWKLHANPIHGVAIQSTVGHFQEALAACAKWKVYLGQVNYIDYEKEILDFGSFLRPINFKRKTFAHENELRAVIWDEQVLEKGNKPFRGQSGDYVEVHLNELIQKVVVSPMATNWFVEVIEDLLDKYGIDQNICEKSLLYRPPEFLEELEELEVLEEREERKDTFKREE